ncbi:MAG: SusC/RagA family TonB-linked outer membrane protein [Bacteroidales bacterium]
MDRQIVLSPVEYLAEAKTQLGTKSEVQQRTVTGTVIDTEGEPVPGATVSVKGTTRGAITDMDGKYQLNVDDGDILLFSFVGYITQEVPVGSNTVVNVTLAADVKSLEEIVVIGYGTVAKSDLTGSVSSLKSDDMNPGANASIDQMMQGRAAGVQITQSSGEPGGGLSIRIRGAASINASNEPLYVIDGFPIDNSANLSGNGIDGSSSVELGTNLSPKNPLNSLNPNDIESIEVLKDASATAIYGSRGANGVILITTKKGASKKMVVNYNTYYGSQSIANPMEVMSTSQYIQFLNEVSVDQGNGEVFSAADISAIGAGTDWQSEIYRSAPIMDHNLSVSGGIGNSRVYASIDYFDQQGIVLETGMKKYIGRLNFDTETVTGSPWDSTSTRARSTTGTDLTGSTPTKVRVPSTPPALRPHRTHLPDRRILHGFP